MNPTQRPEASSFVLDEGCEADLVQVMPVQARWTEFPHARERERGLVMLAGEVLRLPPLVVAPEPVLWLRCLRGLPQISQDGLDVEVWCCMDEGDSRRLVSLRLDNDQVDAGLHEIELSLPLPEGAVVRFEVRCGAGPLDQSEADWLGLTGMVISARDQLALLKARTQHAWRLRNEVEHFNQVYSGEFYRDRQDEGSAALVGEVRQLPSKSGCVDDPQGIRGALRERLCLISPVPRENAFAYTHRLLGALLPIQPPDFPARLRAISKRCGNRPLRMLSLCAGEAAVEGSILQAAAVPVELCIVDVNPHLLEQASLRMPAHVTVDRVLGDVNGIGRQLGQFDVVNITSGLHHLVELESVLSAIAEMLRPAGEFWLVGEQVGRNGNRLWPEALHIANAIFAGWPQDKRVNYNTGRTDESLPDVDYSSACFEGIRSQDILDQLARYFLPVDCYLRDAFLWRLVDVAYAGNFDPGDERDRKMLQDIVVEEAVLWSRGGRGTELHAVYRSKGAALIEAAASRP